MRLALIDNNIVRSVVDADELESSIYALEHDSVVDVTGMTPEPQAGWLLVNNQLVSNGTSGPIRITKLAFRQRFTFSELCAIETAAESNVYVKVLKENLIVSTYVDLTRADTIAGMSLLASLGLITAERTTQILTAPVQEHEKYKE
jgi:hypothetical protein